MVSSTRISRRPKLSMGNSQNHIKFISCIPGTDAHFSMLWLQMCCLKKTYRKSRILHPPSPAPRWHLAAIAQEFNQDVATLSLAEKNKDVFRLFPPTYKECAKLVGFPPRQSILQWTCTGDLYTHELKTCHVKLTSCCCCLHSKSTHA